MFSKLLKNEKAIDKFTQDNYGNIYFQQEDKKGVLLLQNDSSYKLEIIPFLKLEGLYVENICPVDSGNVFNCTEKGLIRYNPQIKTEYRDHFPVLIRKVIANGKLIFGGTETNVNIVELPFKKQTLQFTYSALFYEDHTKTNYSYLLEGYDDKWSDWSLKTEKEYTNLSEGDYVFNVKAKNIYEKESAIAQYQFEILAPWYRTLIAYLIYGILIFIIVWLIVKLNTRRIRIEKENLEKIVKERTLEIVKQKDDIEEKNVELEQQKEEINTQKENISFQAKQLEIKNKELEKLSIAASKTDNAIVIMDAEGNFEWINEGFTRIYNLTLEEFITKRGKNILEVSSNPDIKKIIAKCLTEKITVNYEFSYKKESNEDVWVQTTITPILDKKGNISKLIAIDSDITDIKNAEKEIIRQRDEITDSIIYSKHIQNAILPTIEYTKKLLPDSFIFYKPKEIIGGDFYWVSKQGEKIIIAVADCTGHGIPGALMSMIGITFLNEIVNNKRITDPAEIINRLRVRIINALHQSEEEEGSKDGMDIALCVINKKTNILEYAGANNPLFIIKNNELIELLPDKMPVSIHRMNGRQFTKKEIKIQSGNLIYLFSDGFADQFGGQDNKKFRKSNFKQLLIDISISPINEQLKIISQSFEKWCGINEQVDDVIVMGFMID
ncbi:MAG: SpoIIE family protein phosphatase [Chlorobi bacterium]|nr:SpoIIE family protein phosphatase [Chlorobiota bacterium]